MCACAPAFRTPRGHAFTLLQERRANKETPCANTYVLCEKQDSKFELRFQMNKNNSSTLPGGILKSQHQRRKRVLSREAVDLAAPEPQRSPRGQSPTRHPPPLSPLQGVSEAGLPLDDDGQSSSSNTSSANVFRMSLESQDWQYSFPKQLQHFEEQHDKEGFKLAKQELERGTSMGKEPTIWLYPNIQARAGKMRAPSCERCNMQPIVGPRYMNVMREASDLCSGCMEQVLAAERRNEPQPEAARQQRGPYLRLEELSQMASPCAAFLSAPRHDSRLIQNSDSAADSEGDEFFTQVETHFGSQYEVLETANCGYSADGTAHAGTTRAQARPAQTQTPFRVLVCACFRS